jgi:site-specific recombinase XerD
MVEEIDRYVAESAFSSNTADRYRRALKLICGDVDLGDLTAQGFRAWLDDQEWGSSTRWVAFNAIRGYLSWKYGKDHPALALKIKRLASPPQRVLKFDQVQDLLYSFDTTRPKGIRDLAICLELETRLLQVIVKGGRWGARSFSEFARTWLESWLGIRGGFARTDVSNVFVSMGGNQPGSAMTTRGLRFAVAVWGRRAGVGKLSPHDLRRTMASVTTSLGAPEDIVMKGGGWSNHEVFRRYTVGVGPKELEPWFPTRAAMTDPRTNG